MRPRWVVRRTLGGGGLELGTWGSGRSCEGEGPWGGWRDLGGAAWAGAGNLGSLDPEGLLSSWSRGLQASLKPCRGRALRAWGREETGTGAWAEKAQGGCLPLHLAEQIPREWAVILRCRSFRIF